MFLEIFLLFILVLVYAVMRDRRPANCPPGPPEIPFFGWMIPSDEVKIKKLQEKYGDVVMCRIGTYRLVYIFDSSIARDTLSRPEFSDRPAYYEAFNLDDQKTGGVVFSNGFHWQHDRRFVLRNLRNLGMGRSYLEEAINIEAKALVEDLKMYNGEAIDYPDSFRTAALNIIWQMVASTRYDLHSSQVETIYKISKEFQSNFSEFNYLPMMVPALSRLPKFIRGAVFKERLLDDFNTETRKVVLATVDKHLEDYDPDNPRDLIDEYIKDMKEREGDENSFFRRGALIQIVSEMFQAGSDTISNMLKWVAFLLARYPDYAKRMQKEIDEVVPKDRMVSLDDKPSLALIEAFTTEALRYSSLVILNGERTVTSDTTIAGYFIPKGAVVQAANHFIHHDPRYWDDPHKFYPERFLDESRAKYTAPKQGFFAFGSGRRQCAGELLARMELFLFTAAIIQNFDVVAPEGVDLTKDAVVNLADVRVPADKTLAYIVRK